MKKYVTTEDVTMTVPVAHEEVRIEREPMSDTDVAHMPDHVQLAEGDEEIVLSEEVPVVTKETVPKEKIRLDKKQVTEQRPVHGQVRKEHIKTDDSTKQ